MPEIDQIKNAFTNLNIPETKLLYLNVSKRVNTRIFGGELGAFKNPMPGTAIDSNITDKDIYEFYLISTAAKQGMSTPTRYTIVYDNVKATPD